MTQSALPLVSGNTYLTSLPLVSGNTYLTSLPLVSVKTYVFDVNSVGQHLSLSVCNHGKTSFGARTRRLGLRDAKSTCESSRMDYTYNYTTESSFPSSYCYFRAFYIPFNINRLGILIKWRAGRVGFLYLYFIISYY